MRTTCGAVQSSWSGRRAVADSGWPAASDLNRTGLDIHRSPPWALRRCTREGWEPGLRRRRRPRGRDRHLRHPEGWTSHELDSQGSTDHLRPGKGYERMYKKQSKFNKLILDSSGVHIFIWDMQKKMCQGILGYFRFLGDCFWYLQEIKFHVNCLLFILVLPWKEIL